MPNSNFRVNIPIAGGVGVSAPLEAVAVPIIMVVAIIILAVAAVYLAIPVAIIALVYCVISGSNTKKIVQQSLIEAKNAADIAASAREKASISEDAARREPTQVVELLKVTTQSLQEARASSSLAREKATMATASSKKSLDKTVRSNVVQAEVYAQEAAESAKETLKHHRALQVMVAHASIKGALKNGAGAAVTKLKSIVGGKEQEKPKFADALMAMCALVACVDKVVGGNEKAEVRRIIASDEVLRSLASTQLLEIFDSHCADILADSDWGSVEAKKAIGNFKGRQEEASAIVQVGVMVGQSDDNFSLREIAVVKEMCEMLNLNPSTVGM